MASAVALIPARAGSERVPGKNLLDLAGHPLVAYAIAAAQQSGIFDAVIVSTNSDEIAEVAARYGAEVAERPAEFATSTSADIEWLADLLERLAAAGREYDLFSIVRPTSPFRSSGALRSAFDRLLAVEDAHSIRAVTKVREHPGKMWVVEGQLIRPLLEQGDGTPMHSTPYQALPEVWIQNSSLEIAWSRVAREGGTIAGERVVPFFSDAASGFTIDYPEDVIRAELMLQRGEARLPAIGEVQAA